MKLFFVLMLLASVASVGYELVASLHVMSHNHYEYRHALLDTNGQQIYRLHPNMGLTPEDLSKCDEHVANAYRISVYDGYKLGAGYSALEVQCLALAVLLSLTSILGINAVRRGDSRGGRMPNQSIQPTPTNKDVGA